MDQDLKVQGTNNQYMTEDYGIFVTLKGNRGVSEKHVKHIIKQMTEQGNLIDKFPIVVNEYMELIDGQHRLAALKQLKWPVVYEIRDGLNIANVRTINTAHQNWSWLDFAKSYADLGNDNYVRFLNLYKEFGYPYSVLMYYTESIMNKHRGSHFYMGEYVIKDQQKAFELLKQYQEVSEAAEHHSREFAYAMKDCMAAPGYDQKKMVEKMEKYGQHKLKPLRAKVDYARAIEDIYNTYVSEPDKVRLF